MIEALEGKRILVTGATGFIGGHLARRLHADGAHVLALERTPGKGDALAELGIEVVWGDITDHERMAEIVSRDVHIVMHIAAWTDSSSGPARRAEEANVAATRHLARSAAQVGVARFIYTSSIAVYGLKGDNPVDETTPVEPFGDPYGDSKIRAERALHQVGQETGLDYVIVRPGQVYGPGSAHWTIRLALAAKRGELPLFSGGRGAAHPIYVDDLVTLLLLCAVHPNATGQVFNGVGDGATTWADFFGGYMQMILTRRALRLPCWMAHTATVIANPFTRNNLPYLIDHLCGQGRISNRKAKELLGWTPHISLEEGLARCEAWLRAEGIL
jgi:nucleoside-diphosphate-sugar epimerase